MLRSELKRAVDDLLKVLRELKILDTLRSLLSESGNLREAFDAYRILSERLTNPTTRKLLDILGLSPLLQAEWWGKLSGAKNEETHRTIGNIYTTIQFALEKLPQIAQLVGPPSDEQLSGQSVLTLYVPEGPGEKSKPERI